MSIAVPLYGFGASGGSPNKSTIIVSAPTGSTVTCKMGSITKTATEKNGIWTFGGLDLGTWTIKSTKGGDSATQDVAITRLTVEYVTIVYRITPEFTYTGDYTIVDDSDNPISDFANWKNNWKIRFLTSGTLTFTNLNGAEGGIDVFLVGGGAAGATGSGTCHGGGGGYTLITKNVSLQKNTPYEIVIGAGGNAAAAQGGDTSAFSYTAAGGKNPDGGSGGGKGGTSSTNGGNGASDGGTAHGTGQGTTTREFGEEAGTLYSPGGGGGGRPSGTGGEGGGGDGSYDGAAGNGAENKGAGGGGSRQGTVGTGGSGIVIARNARGAA